MQEPEWPVVCECKYDETHDRMDREDCCFHCEVDDELSLPQESPKAPKKAVTIASRAEESVA